MLQVLIGSEFALAIGLYAIPGSLSAMQNLYSFMHASAENNCLATSGSWKRISSTSSSSSLYFIAVEEFSIWHKLIGTIEASIDLASYYQREKINEYTDLQWRSYSMDQEEQLLPSEKFAIVCYPTLDLHPK